MASEAAPLAGATAGGPDDAFVLVEWLDPGGVTSRERPIAGLHVHHEDDEAWYVVEGRLGFRIGDHEVDGRAGCSHVRPAGDAPQLLERRPRAGPLRARDDAADPGIDRGAARAGCRHYAAIFRQHASELL